MEKLDNFIFISALSSSLVGTQTQLNLGQLNLAQLSPACSQVSMVMWVCSWKHRKKRETARYVFTSASNSAKWMAIVSDMLQNIRFFSHNYYYTYSVG